jgi:hypothetical protein
MTLVDGTSGAHRIRARGPAWVADLGRPELGEWTPCGPEPSYSTLRTLGLVREGSRLGQSVAPHVFVKLLVFGTKPSG